MALHKRFSPEKRLQLVLWDSGRESSVSLQITDSVSRLARLALTPIRSLRWAWAKRRTERRAPNGPASVRYRAIDHAGW